MLLFLCFLSLVSPASQARVQVGPVRVFEGQSTTTSTTVIRGPQGTRTIRSTDNVNVQEIPTQQTRDTDSHTEVEGVEDPGIKIERKSYYFNNSGGPVVVTHPATTVTGGPGSIDTKTHSQTRTLPPVRVDVK